MANRVCIAAICFLLPGLVGAQASDENKLKAAFLFNFAKFVEWPAQSFQSPGDPIAICVAGEARIAFPLEEAVRGKTVEGRKVVVNLLTEGRRPTCHILFIASTDAQRIQALLDTAKSGGVLTVGQSGDFASRGGIINLRVEDNHVYLEINTATAEQAHLKISAKLLSLAKVIRK